MDFHKEWSSELSTGFDILQLDDPEQNPCCDSLEERIESELRRRYTF